MKTSKGFGRGGYFDTKPVGAMFSCNGTSGRVDAIAQDGKLYVYEQRNDGSHNIPLRVEESK